MAARDGTYRDGLYHFECEACGKAVTARRAHARSCSSTCAARLRRREQAHRDKTAGGPTGDPRAPMEFRFYISRRKVEACLATLDDARGPVPELIVGFDLAGRDPEIARLRIEATDHDDGGLVWSVTAPYDPFEGRRSGSEPRP